MNTSDKIIQLRLAARGPEGEPQSLIAGTETLAELREVIVGFSEGCPAGRNHPHCPFRLLSGLSYDSLTNLVNSMSRETCLDLFQQELQCRSQAGGPGRTCMAPG